MAELLIEGHQREDAVRFSRTTYDEENSEPVVLPGAFPNLLPMAPPGSQSAGRPRSRRTTQPNFAMRP